MSKLVKELITNELKERYAEQNNAVWIELVGVDGTTTNEFRGDLRGREMRMEVVKTALFRRACAESPLAPLADQLEGPAALITGGESAIDVAKLLEDWAPKFPKDTLRLRGALLEGEYLDESQVQDLHKMPSRADLQAKIVLIVTTPGRNVVGAAVSPGRKVVGAIKQIAEKLEKGETIERVQA